MTSEVLVIGGGFAGAKLATALAKNGVGVTLVSRTEFFEASFANARSVVEPNISDKAIWAYKDMKPHGTFIQGEVVQLTDRTATLADGQVLKFDYAAVCTGSDYAVGKSSTATSLEERKTEVQVLAGRVKAALTVVVVGGGPLGVELAGEIVTDLPDVGVTLIQSGPSLLPTLPAKLGAAAEAWLKGRGCKVVLNDRLDVPAGSSGRPFKGLTRAGVEASCDVLLMATGITVNSRFMQPHLADALDAQGRIKVDKHLRVVGHPTLFALGDVTDVPEEKLAFLAAQQGQLVANSISSLIAAENKGGKQAVAPAAKLLGAWRPSMGIAVMFVTLGRNYGVGRIGCLTFAGWLPTHIKSRNIGGFVDKYRQALLQHP